MPESAVVHSTYVIERSYSSSPQRVFAAFSDLAKKRRWFAEGESTTLEEFAMDFRVGGREHAVFRMSNGMVCRNDTVYMDIVPDQRIVIAYTMSVNGARISSSQATTELQPSQNGARLVFTEQAAFFEGADGPKIREEGWRLLLEQLENELASGHA
jgi:uncharacterized protein YndB with AHSA1/START domain